MKEKPNMSIFFKKTIRLMTEEKINNFLNAPINSMNLGHIENFNLKNRVHLFWGDESIGFLTKGKNIFSPIA